jgi:hypothetical protein
LDVTESLRASHLALRLTHLLVGVAVQTLRGTLLASRLSYCA